MKRFNWGLLNCQMKSECVLDISMLNTKVNENHNYNHVSKKALIKYSKSRYKN